jgi:hypothetical protein
MDSTPTQNGIKPYFVSYTKKGKHDDLNNYRGICLQDLIIIYVSSSISSRLLTMLKEHGIEEQLGCQPLRGCQEDALFIVRSALLQIRHKHMQATWGSYLLTSSRPSKRSIGSNSLKA